MNWKLKALITLNIIAGVIGLFYYWQQLLSTNISLWIFVADCPLFFFFFAGALFFAYKKKHDWFNFLAFAGAAKYGFWTLFVLTTYSEYYFTPELAGMYSLLLLAHIGLMIQPVFLLGKIKPSKHAVAFALGFFLISDWFDYVVGTHPPIPLAEIESIYEATIIMSFAFVGLSWFLLSSKIKSPINIFTK